MTSYQDALTSAIRKGICTFLRNYSNLQEIVRFLWEPLPVPQNTPFNAAKHLIPWVCNESPPPQPPPEFEGGQCDNVPYRVTIGTRLFASIVTCEPQAQETITTRDVFGPVREFRKFDEGLQNSGFCTGFRGVDVFARPALNAPSEYIPIITLSSRLLQQYRVISVERLDNLPDDCGSPPPPIPPYQEGDNIINIEFEYSPDVGVPIILGGVLALGYANLNVNADVTIPFTFEFTANFEGKLIGELNVNDNTITIDARPNPPGGDRLPDIVRPPGGVQIPGTPIEPPDSPEDDLEDEEDDDTPEKTRLLRGVVVTVTSINGRNPFTEIFQNENPNVWVPDLGLVQFLIRTGKLNSAWTEDIRVKNIRQFIPVPHWEYGAIKVSGTPRQGVQWTLTPVFVQADKTNEFSLLP